MFLGLDVQETVGVALTFTGKIICKDMPISFIKGISLHVFQCILFCFQPVFVVALFNKIPPFSCLWLVTAGKALFQPSLSYSGNHVVHFHHA